MEATLTMPAAAPVQKQQGLNQVVINKVRRMVEGRQQDVMAPSLACSKREKSHRTTSHLSGSAAETASSVLSCRSRRRAGCSFQCPKGISACTPMPSARFPKRWASRQNTSASFRREPHGRNSCAPPS